jgi:hypothetical protein
MWIETGIIMANNNKNIRTAAGFGGVGGGGSGAWSPGGSPIAKGGQTQGNFNQFVDDASFETILARIHQDAPDDPERNLEARLVPQHQDKEYGALNNLDILDVDERNAYKLRTKLRAHKHMLEKAATQMQANPHHQKIQMSPMEESLAARRKYKDGQKFDYEDDVPPQIKPERYHPVLSNNKNERVAIDFAFRRRDHITDAEPGDADAWWQATKNQVPMGKAPLLTEGAEMDQYFDELLNENNPNPSGLWNEENIQNEEIVDPDTKPNFSGNNSAKYDDPKNDLTMSLEQQLHGDSYEKNQYDRNNFGNEPIGFDDNPLMRGQGNYPRVPWA